MGENALVLSNIVKRFPGVIADDHVDFTLKKGEVHALLGENGAGKTSLMNIVYGIYKEDEGEIRIDDRKVDINSPHKAMEYGIGMIQQHFSLVPSFSVTENIALGLKELGMLPKMETVKKRIRELSKKYNLLVDPDSRIWQLSAGEQQRVEILKLLYIESKIMIFDEPTAILTPQEAEGLFKTIREMIKNGASVIFISHKLKEVMEISDRITIMRHGKVINTVTTNETDENSIARMMVGREVILKIKKGKAKPGKEILTVKDLRALNDKGTEALRGMELHVREGEILGIAGVEGNGQRELAESIYGMRKFSGKMEINGKKMRQLDVAQRIKNEVAYIPQDRKGVAICGGLPIYYNLFLKLFRTRKSSFRPFLFNPASSLRKIAEKYVEEYSISTASVDLEARFLSGGNMQKVVLARETSGSPKLIIAVHPTRGLDVGAEEFVYKSLIKARDEGAAILLIAGDLYEIFNLSDRVAVIYEGKIVGYSQPDESHLEEIGLMMAGIRGDKR